MGIGLGGLAGLGSLGMGIYGLATNSAPQSQVPNVMGAANSAYSNIGGLGQYNMYAPNLGTAQGITSGLVNNPYAGQYQQGAGVASGLGTQAALNQYGTGGTLAGAGNAVLNTAFDPQSALYNYTLAQTINQQNAQNAAAGVGMTPYGAGLQDQNIQQFNMNWQNQQLGRELSGLQGAGGAYQTAAGLQSSAPGQYLQSAAMPYSTYGAIGQGQLGALSSLGQYGAAGANQANQQIGDYLSYIQAGNQAQQVANQTALTQAQLQNNYLGQIGAGLSGLGGAYSGYGGSGFGGSSVPLSGYGGLGGYGGIYNTTGSLY